MTEEKQSEKNAVFSKKKINQKTRSNPQGKEFLEVTHMLILRDGGLGSKPKKMYGERLGDGVEYHLMSPTPRR